jgi:hypothetical protein
MNSTKLIFMKLVFIMTAVFFCVACNTSTDRKSEEATITKLLEDETHFAAKGDSANWASCWINSNEASFIITTADGAQVINDFNSLAQELRQVKPFELKLTRNNYKYAIGNEVAFVSFDQQDNWAGAGRKTKETRTLKKMNGEWKIVHAAIVDVSSFAGKETGSFHMAVNEIQKNPRNGFTNLSGLGGMSVGYMEIPAPADFTPFFEGLPGNMCNSPHWGYVIEGALRIRYSGGKEETVNAGEVFYWPAPHTGIVDKNVKFIDFSPDRKFIPVMDHLAKKMAESATR